MQFYDDHLTRPVGPKEMEQAIHIESGINAVRKKMRKQSVQRMNDQNSIKIEMICIDVLTELEKIGDHSFNIIEALNRREVNA